MYLAPMYLHNVATNVLKSDANFYIDCVSDNTPTCTTQVASDFARFVAVLHCFREKIHFFYAFSQY